MALFTEKSLRDAANIVRKSEGFTRSANRILLESAVASTGQSFDIFLSHSFNDAELVLGLKNKLNEYGHSVYVDWIEDTQLDRSKVNRETAAVLRERMKCCRSLFYAVTSNSSSSKWMPWECGFFDAHGGKVAICPITNTAESSYAGQEYLGLYPYTVEEYDNGNRKRIYVEYSPTEYNTLEAWLKGESPYKR